MDLSGNIYDTGYYQNFSGWFSIVIQKRDPSTMQPLPAAPRPSPNGGRGSGTSNEAPAKKQQAWLVWPSVAAAGAGDAGAIIETGEASVQRPRQKANLNILGVTRH